MTGPAHLGPAGPELDPPEFPADTGPAPTGRPKARRLLGMFVAIVLVGATVASVVVAVQTDRSARAWRDRAHTAQERLEELRGEQRETRQRLDEAADTIAALEDRTIELADEKARALDRATLAEVDGATALGVADRLEACTTGLIDVFRAVAAASSQEELDGVAGGFEATAALCEQAAGGARGLAEFLTGGPGS